ncbi:MAG: DNA adenine methylase [Rhodoferax sp.]|nr:DNA adenine methylase [Rhodoferax sp.]MCF8208042.1 DNA adenine methylase [Rhodoferax sp.]
MTQVQRDFFGLDSPGNVRPVNVASVPQRSPFRYPGGKTWFIPRLREWLRHQYPKPKRLIEPFAGGGIVSLTAAFENLVECVLMVELDDEISAVWDTIISGKGAWLANRILYFEMSKENAVNEITRCPQDRKEKAFQTIIKNRTFHGGILAAGSGFLKNGEAGKGILSRWYPATLAKRITDINHVLPKLQFQQDDAFATLDQYKNDVSTVFFVDPPYTAGGKNAGNRLYTHFKIDHDMLFQKCSELAGDFIMTYDNSDEVRSLACKYSLQAKPIPMKNTHHAEMTELVIGRDLSWMDGTERVCEPSTEYQMNKPDD